MKKENNRCVCFLIITCLIVLSVQCVIAERNAGVPETGGVVTQPSVLKTPPGAAQSGRALRLLYENGPFITTYGGGTGGADISELQTNLGMATLGESCQLSGGHWVADDVVVDETWNIEYVILFVYQTNSGTTSTINDVRLQIRDGSPEDGGTVIWGDTTTNRLVATDWTIVYRVRDVTPWDIDRPIMYAYCAVPVVLEPGTYWLEWSVGGTLPSGPRQSPISILGSTTTGNALHYTTYWQPFLDFGTSTPQGVPFRIAGDRSRGVILSFDDMENEEPVGNHYEGVTFSPGWKAWNSTGWPTYPAYSPPNVALTFEQDNFIEWDENVAVVKLYVNCSSSGPTWTYTVYDAFGTPLDSFTISDFINNYKVELSGRGIRRLEIRGTGQWNLYNTIDHLSYEPEGPTDCPPDSVFSRAMEDPPGPSINGHISDQGLDMYCADRFNLPPGQQQIRAVQWWGMARYFPETDFRIAFYTDGGAEPGSMITYSSGPAECIPTGYTIGDWMLYYHYYELPSIHTQNIGWISIYGRDNSDVFFWVNSTSGPGDAVYRTGEFMGVWMPLSDNLAFCLIPPEATPTPVPTDTPTAVPTDTPTSAPTDTPMPGTPTATPPPEPTNTPTAPPTNTPTWTPGPGTPTDTPTAVPTDTPVVPTATPDPGCTETGCEVYMPSAMFHGGDPCYCLVHVCNTDDYTYTDIPLFVILDVYGIFFFAPSFGEFDYYQLSIPPGLMTIQVLPEFTWPEGAGSASGIVWYAAMTDPQITQLHGKLGLFTFGWN